MKQGEVGEDILYKKNEILIIIHKKKKGNIEYGGLKPDHTHGLTLN